MFRLTLNSRAQYKRTNANSKLLHHNNRTTLASGDAASNAGGTTGTGPNGFIGVPQKFVGAGVRKVSAMADMSSSMYDNAS